MHITMVCWGNICRSPMAERIARAYAEAAGDSVADLIIDSVGISAEETGNPIDPRAVAVLEEHGYKTYGHCARQATRTTVAQADLLVAAEPFHLDHLRALGASKDQLRLMTDFDPESDRGAPLPDPWYGDAEDFGSTLDVLERAMPRLIEHVAQHSASSKESR